MMNYLSEEEIAIIRCKIIDEGKLIQRRIDESIPTAAHQDTEEVEGSTSQTSVNKKRKLVDILSKASTSGTQTVNNEDSEERTQRELTCYLQMPCPDMQSNPLDWWKVHHTQFTILSLMAKKYLSICATSCASERVFSTGDNVITP